MEMNPSNWLGLAIGMSLGAFILSLYLLKVTSRLEVEITVLKEDLLRIDRLIRDTQKNIWSVVDTLNLPPPKAASRRRSDDQRCCRC